MDETTTTTTMTNLERTTAAICAERVLSIFEAVFPADDRPRKAVEAAWRLAFVHNVETQAQAAEAAEAAKAAYRAATAENEHAAAWAAQAAAHAAQEYGTVMPCPSILDTVLYDTENAVGEAARQQVYAAAAAVTPYDVELPRFGEFAREIAKETWRRAWNRQPQ